MSWFTGARALYVACGALVAHASVFLCWPLFWFAALALDPGAGRGPGKAPWVLLWAVFAVVAIGIVTVALRLLRLAVSVPSHVSAFGVALLTVAAGLGAWLLTVPSGKFGRPRSEAWVLGLTVPATLAGGYWASRRRPG